MSSVDFQEVYRLNLELGQFLAPYSTKASEVNCCAINEEHGLLAVGTASGHVEAWDPRTKSRQGILDCALHCTDSEYRYETFCYIVHPHNLPHGTAI